MDVVCTDVSVSLNTEVDLLDSTPLAGVLVGYGRVSTREQNLARQRTALTAAGCAKCFFDKASGKNTDRPELNKVSSTSGPVTC